MVSGVVCDSLAGGRKALARRPRNDYVRRLEVRAADRQVRHSSDGANVLVIGIDSGVIDVERGSGLETFALEAQVEPPAPRKETYEGVLRCGQVHGPSGEGVLQGRLDFIWLIFPI